MDLSREQGAKVWKDLLAWVRNDREESGPAVWTYSDKVEVTPEVFYVGWDQGEGEAEGVALAFRVDEQGAIYIEDVFRSSGKPPSLKSLKAVDEYLDLIAKTAKAGPIRMAYVFAERRNPNGAGKQRLYGFDNGFGLCVEGGISEEWNIWLIWFAGGPGVMGRFRDRNSGKFKYGDITGRHPNFKEPLYGATLGRVNQTAEWVQGWMAPIGGEPWSEKKAQDRSPQDRSGAIERQDMGEVAGQQGVADGDRQELTRKLTGQNQTLAEVTEMMAESMEEAILDALTEKSALVEALGQANSLQKQQQAKLKERLKQNFQERERELSARKNEILRNQGLAERIEQAKRFTRSSDQGTVSAAQAAADRRNVFLQTLIGEYDRKVVAAGIVYIIGICKDLEAGTISDGDAAELVEGAPAGLSSVSRDLLREFYASGQALTRIDENPNPLFSSAPGVFQGISTGQSFPIQSADRLRDGVFVDPLTGLSFEEMQKEAKELLAQRKAEEKKKKLKTRRQKVEGLTTEAEDHLDDLPPKSKRRVIRIEGDDHADPA